MKNLPKHYDHLEAEPRLQAKWEASGVYAWDETQPRANTFVIDTPAAHRVGCSPYGTYFQLHTG